MRKLLLKCGYALGDIVVLTGAVRDLHRAYPGRFEVRVQTSCEPLWWHNPLVRPSDGLDRGAQVIECACPLINGANRLPAHFLHGYTDFLADQLGIRLMPFEFRGDIHLSPAEKRAPSPITAYTRRALPYWLILGGGKDDLTIKWWSHERYQQVVDHFRGRVLLVQAGRLGDHHPRLHGTLDLRGRTSLRELVMWVHHAQGIVCGVTGLMHLAAAVPRPNPAQGHRPCVVIAGGREPAHWEAYPGHQFLHTIGTLACCKDGGCWRARTRPLGDGSPHDAPDELCVDVTRNLPRCMHQITAADVIRHVENYLSNGQARVLSRRDARAAKRGVQSTEDGKFEALEADWRKAPERALRFLRSVPRYPQRRYAGRGVVMCAGGVVHFANAWASLHVLRETGCKLPIELWHLGATELDERQRRLLEPLQVRCVNALAKKAGRRLAALPGYALKAFALLHCSFREVLLLDADNLAVRNPEFLFRNSVYRRTGAVFWPDYGRLGSEAPIWRLCGVPYRDEPEFESGQILVHKRKCWLALNLAWHYNEQAALYYRVIHGDKDTFHFAFRKTGHPYAMPWRPVLSVGKVMVQHDLRGQRLFEHLAFRKLQFFQPNPPIAGLRKHPRALFHLQRLQQLWDGRIHGDEAHPRRGVPGPPHGPKTATP